MKCGGSSEPNSPFVSVINPLLPYYSIANMKCGGSSEVKPADAEVKEICQKIKGAAETHAAKKFECFEAVEYCSQMVAGTNYFVKVKVDNGDSHVHVRVFKSLPHAGAELSVHSMQQEKTSACPLEYF
eukprot:sb/3475326/